MGVRARAHEASGAPVDSLQLHPVEELTLLGPVLVLGDRAGVPELGETDQPRPSDIDGCFDLTPKVNQQQMVPFLPVTDNNRRLVKMIHKAELFPAEETEGKSGLPWKEFFQRDRSGVRKGIVAIKVGG